MMIILKLIAILFILETATFVIEAHSTARIEAKLQRDNAVIKSIQSEDGDIIDCVDIYKQPAFSHPALKNHKIQLKPSFVPTVDLTSRKIEKAKGNNKLPKPDVPISVTAQLWRRNGSCPEGTVPIRRAQPKSAFGSKNSNSFFRRDKHQHFNESKAVNLLRPNHSMSIMITEGYAYLGAKGDIAIGYPRVELDDEYTLSHVTLDFGHHDNFEEIRSRWAVNPGAYGDRQTRFFTYWTVDGSHETGCFDHICPGFVGVSPEIALGAAIHPISRPNDVPLDEVVIIYIFKDAATNNWWVNYGADVNIGYWPAELFRALSHHAESVQWGGDVHSSRVGTHPHTETGMGNGQYGTTMGSGVVRRLRVLENSMELKYPEWATTFADEYSCYNYLLYRDVEDPEFYYGGPGKDPRCP